MGVWGKRAGSAFASFVVLTSVGAAGLHLTRISGSNGAGSAASILPARAASGESQPDLLGEAGCGAGLVQACDPHEAGCQAGAFALVRCLARDERPLVTPPIRFVPHAEMMVRVSPSPERDGERDSIRRAALSWFGLHDGVAPDLARQHPPLGFYSYRDGVVYLLEHPEALAGHAAFYTLVHELAHSLQGADHAGRGTGRRWFDEELAERALREGEARYYEDWARALVRGYATQSWLERYAREPAQADEAAQRAASPASTSPELFELPYGTRFAAVTKSVDSSLRQLARPDDAPPSSARLLASVWGWAPARYETLPETAETSAGSTARWVDRLGAWMVRTFLLRTLGRGEPAWSFAASLRGDRFVVVEAVDGRRSAHWTLAWSDETAAKGVEAALRAHQRAASSAVAVTREGPTVRLSVQP